ncbi:hypothetical protein [Sphingobacterium sp.]|nr:hypothetical protein [Sphingobacterium sp.]
MNKTKLKSEKEDDPPVMPKWPKASPIMYFTGIVILIFAALPSTWT